MMKQQVMKFSSRWKGFAGWDRIITSRSYCTKVIINDFWNGFYRDYEDKCTMRCYSSPYYSEVIDLLMDKKKSNGVLNDRVNMSAKELQDLQIDIEDLTMKFDDKNIFKETPNLTKLLIGTDLQNCKSYLYDKLDKDLYSTSIELFGPYTLEAIIIYVLALLFNSLNNAPYVKLATLLETLNRTVIAQGIITMKDRAKSQGFSREEVQRIEDELNNAIKDKKCIIGTSLVQFMMERRLINAVELKEDDNSKKKGQSFKKSFLVVVCNFDLSIIPLKLNLPMICKPLEWEHLSEKDFHFDFEKDNRKPYLLSDMVGGYLSRPSFDIYNAVSPLSSFDKNRFSLLTSRNLRNFNIELDEHRYKEMCHILTGLQSQGFKINQKLLEFIKKNRALLEQEGLLMPEMLAHVNLKEAFDLVRVHYNRNEQIKGLMNITDLLKELGLRVQNARYQDFIIRLASAYESFVFYMPAILDFRGRIYRSGVLHFHGPDIAKSLLVFADTNQDGMNQSYQDIVATAAAFKYKKFHLYEDALIWYKENHSLIYASDESLICFSKGASDPYQFLAKALSYDTEYMNVPISQDATASAYQIMSYFLLNEDMAMRTNLIPHPDGQIQDVYTYLLHDLKLFLQRRLNDPFKMEIIESKLDRKLIKSLFMPLIYGKTLNSMVKDIRLQFGELLSTEDSYKVAKHCNEFMKEKYPDIISFMKLISSVSWFSSALDRAVDYSVPYFTTKQDYMAFIKEEITVYERASKKKRRVTLTVPTMIRDKRKTQAAACANFIHQKDAYIAMKVVESLLKKGAPIYTVHDNFLTTPTYVRMLPDIYTDVIAKMGHPLQIINEFIRMNLINPYRTMKEIPAPLLYHYHELPFPSDSLSSFLNALSPSKQKQWNTKVDEFLQLYNNYVRVVCTKGYEDPNHQLIKEKWNRFKKILVNRIHNYSLHY